ncbi:isoprenoid synthase domain-containing protein [Mycena crocata]|nr:isoprenoid synthase domain-containing protein [Mycena crocata]
MDLHNLLSQFSQKNSDNSTDDSSILEPYTYIASNAGKNFRGRLIESFNEWLQVPPDTLASISKIIDILHTASLMIDDIEDDSQLRRGKPVAHKIYGIPQTLNAANYMYFLAFEELSRIRSPVNNSTPDLKLLYDILTSELLSLHRGQGLEILWRDSLHCPTEEEYIDMVNNKTGGLLRIGIRLMMACATTNTGIDYVPLANMIGITFQIRDDFMNLQSSLYEVNKGLAEDLTEGKFSFPIIHGIRQDVGNRQILNVLQKRPTTPTLKIHTIAYLKSHTRSFEYTLAVLTRFEKEIDTELERLGGNPSLKELMEKFHVSQE